MDPELLELVEGREPGGEGNSFSRKTKARALHRADPQVRGLPVSAHRQKPRPDRDHTPRIRREFPIGQVAKALFGTKIPLQGRELRRKFVRPHALLDCRG